MQNQLVNYITRITNNRLERGVVEMREGKNKVYVIFDSPISAMNESLYDYFISQGGVFEDDLEGCADGARIYVRALSKTIRFVISV